MKTLILLSFFFVSCAAEKTVKCWVEFGLNCKVLNEDLRDVSDVVFDIEELDAEDFAIISLIETKLTEVPGGIFETFIEAEKFVLSENELKQWKSRYLKGAKKLTHLLITENSITNLVAGSFAEAPNLKIIEITHSKLTSIAPNAFGGLKNLIDLRLQENKIGQELNWDTFSEISESLIKLNIADNKIEKIPEKFLKKFRKLEELTIYFNENIKQVEGDVFPESLKEIVGLIQFKINNPPRGLQFQLDEHHFGKHVEL